MPPRYYIKGYVCMLSASKQSFILNYFMCKTSRSFTGQVLRKVGAFQAPEKIVWLIVCLQVFF